MIDMEKLIKILEQYPITYTIHKNNIPLQVEFPTLRIKATHYEDILGLLRELREFEGLYVEVEEVRI